MRKHAWMSDLLRSTWQAAVLGLVMVLGCLIFSASCCRLISPASCYAAWSSLNHVKLLDLVFIMPRCLIVSIPHATLLNLPHRMSVCYVSWCSLSHVMLFDLVIKKVRCLIFGNLMLRSWPAFVMVLVFSIYCWIFCLVFMLLRCLTFSTSC